MSKIIVYNGKHTKDKGVVMCKKLDELCGKTPEQLLMQCGENYKIPVDVDLLIKKLGIALIPDTFEEIEKAHDEGEIWGLVLESGDDVGIFYKSTVGDHKRRFTIAHELGHCCNDSEILRDGYIEYRKEMNSDIPREKMANVFAGELLMPRDSLEYAIQRLRKPSLKGLADLFEVSTQVMRARLEHLHIDYYDDDLEKMIYI